MNAKQRRTKKRAEVRKMLEDWFFLRCYGYIHAKSENGAWIEYLTPKG